jgi:hypothetical protein
MTQGRLSAGRWAHVFSTIVLIAGIVFGLVLTDNAINDVRIYTDIRFGITAFYPATWSFASSPDFVFRARNLTERGFPTTIQIRAQAVPDSISPRQVFDTLSLERLQTLASYNVISSPYTITLADGVPALVIEYAYANAEADPFLERIPTIIRGQDVVTIRRGQAVTISYLSDEQSYEQNLPVFEEFLLRLRL